MILFRNKIIFVLILCFSVSGAKATQVISLYQQGKINAIRAGLSGGMWNGTISKTLAQALTEEVGLDAMLKFQEVTRSSNARPQQKSLAWFNLYGYSKLVADKEGMAEALRNLSVNKQFASQLFADGKIPSVTQAVSSSSSQGTHYAVQIGAFGSKSNAERLASKERKRGFTVNVVPLKRPNKTLYAVRIGQFNSSRDASNFGKKYYGREGKDFSIVK